MNKLCQCCSKRYFCKEVELLKVIEEIGEQTKYKQDKNTKLYLESLHNTLLNIYVWL